MTKNELQQMKVVIGDLLDEKLDEKLDKKFDEKFKVFATKDDLKRFATKDDLKRFATKDDLFSALKNYPTKKDLAEELKGFATKDDMEKMEDRIMTSVGGGFNEMQEQMDERFGEVHRELDKRPTKNDLLRWTDKNVDPLKKDIKKVKYLHRKGWNDLPVLSSINRSLSKMKIK